MQHNKTFAKLTLSAAGFALFCAALLMYFTSCSKPEPRYCVCTSIWDKEDKFHHPDATTNEACSLKEKTIHRNLEVYCIIE